MERCILFLSNLSITNFIFCFITLLSFKEHVFWRYAISRALHFDDSGTTHPMHNPTVQSPSDIDAMVSAITYEKVSPAFY